jgi:hypothetical protein
MLVIIKVYEEIQLKSIRISLIVTLIVAAFLCMGFVAALNQDEASVHNSFFPSTITPGQSVTATIFFTSNTTDTLQITRIGFHFDWMNPVDYVGADLTSSPVTIAGSSTQSIGQLNIPIPANVTLGVHTYTIVIDGTQGAASTDFSWTSPSLSVAAIGSNSQTAGPTVTSAPTKGGGQSSGQPDLQLYGAMAAVVVIVVLLVIVLLLRRRKPKPEQPVPSKTEPQQETPPPEQKPEQKPNSGQDFDI